MQSAGQRTHRVRFERRVTGPKSPSGAVEQDWSTRVECWAGFRPKFGSEKLAAGQLESTALGVLTVLRWPVTAAVTAADRVVFVAGAFAGRVCQIRSIAATSDNREIEFLLEDGAPT